MGRKQTEVTKEKCRRNAGRPRKIINIELLREYAAYNLTNDELASLVGCDEKTLTTNFSDILEAGKKESHYDIKKWQYKIMHKGCAQMAVHLGECILKQTPNSAVLEERMANLEAFAEKIDSDRQGWQKEHPPTPPEETSAHSESHSAADAKDSAAHKSQG